MKQSLWLIVLVVFVWAERIVSLGPAVTNQIVLLNSGNDIVGKSDYCDPAAGKNGDVISIGTLLTPSLETIVALKPTVIFTSGLTPEPQKEKLKSLGFKVVSIADPESYLHLCNNLKTVSKALGKETVADSILQECQVQYDLLRSSIKEQQAKRLFFQLGTSPLYTVIKGSLGDELITLIGGRNIFNLTVSGEVSRESVLLADPEVILISKMGKMSENEQRVWSAYPSLSASQNSAVFLVDAYAIGSPTPVSFLQTVADLKEMVRSADAE